MTHSVLDADATSERSNGTRPHAAFGYDIDGTGYEYDQPTITGAQLRFLAGLHPHQALVRILDDGSRVTVTPAETVSLTSGARFTRRPRFRRG
ncbi:MAG TPA: multiubiquitin domain-containing protein [Jatrophihabitans sp.]|jgi:hypothetical protein